MTENEKIHLLALAGTPGVGAVTIRHLLRFAGSPSGVFDLSFRQLVRIRGIGEKTARQIRRKEMLKASEEEWRKCLKEGIALLFFTDEAYPRRLKPLYDSPAVLYFKGDAPLNSRYSVGIVGTRKISDYGREMTEEIVRGLGPFRPLVVSGLAYGVDIVAHRACLKNNLATIGVMANGLETIYPSAHRRTAQEMIAGGGGLLTESTLDTKPDFMRFPARNRVIAGMCDLLVVVESGEKGGSLITAEFAQNYHRDVFAVPGNLTNAQSAGCNGLIREHKAAIFTSVEEMAKGLNWTVPLSGEEETAGPSPVFDGFTQEEGMVLALLRREQEVHIDRLSAGSGLPAGKLANLLLHLEFQGLLRMLPGSRYRIV